MRLIPLLLILLLCMSSLCAQKPRPDGDDTTRNALLESYQQQITRYEWERLKDSVRKTELEDSIRRLGQAELRKRVQLEEELRQLHLRDSLLREQKKKEIDSLRKNARGYPVYGLFEDTLFLIYSRRGGFTPEERAAAITRRINVLAHSLTFYPDSIRLIPEESMVEMVYADAILMTVSESDALWYSTTREALAEEFRKLIRDDIVRYKSETSVARLSKEIGMALLILSILFTLIYLLNRLAKWVGSRIALQENKLLKGIQWKNYTLFNSRKEVELLQRVTQTIKWVIIIILVYVTLPLLFGLFPWTRNLAGTLTGYILKPLRSMAWKLWHYLPNLITIIILCTLFYYLQKFLRFLRREVADGKLRFPGFHRDWANPTYHILRILLFAFLFVLIFPYLPGSDSPVFKGVSVFLGFLFTFGSAGSLSNVISGLILTYMRQFRMGDRVKIGEVTGDVVEKSMLVTRIKTVKNEIISIPNSTVMNSHTTNYSEEARGQGLILYTTVTIGYSAPWRQVHAALLKAAAKTHHILQDPAPFVLQTSLNDFYVSYQLNAYTREALLQPEIYSRLHENIQDCCNEAGIEIMSPHYRALRDGNSSTIPLPDTGKDTNTGEY